MNYIPSFLQSSVDPSQISLTIQSFGKGLAGFVALIAVMKGIDPVAAQNSLNAVVGYAATFATAAYTAVQAAEMIYGLLRKIFVRLFPGPIVTTQVVTSRVIDPLPTTVA